MNRNKLLSSRKKNEQLLTFLQEVSHLQESEVLSLCNKLNLSHEEDDLTSFFQFFEEANESTRASLVHLIRSNNGTTDC